MAMPLGTQNYYNSGYDAAYYPQAYGAEDAQVYYYASEDSKKPSVTQRLRSLIHIPTIRGLAIFIIAGFLLGGALVATVISKTGGLVPEVVSAGPSERYEKFENRVCSGRSTMIRDPITYKWEPAFVANQGEVIEDHPYLTSGSRYTVWSNYGGSYNNDIHNYETFVAHAKTICGAMEDCDGINTSSYGNEYGFDFVAVFLKKPSSICIPPNNFAIFEGGPYLTFGNGEPDINCFLKEGVREKYVTPSPNDIC